MFEAEPTFPCESLHVPRLVPGLSGVHEDERARRQERGNRERHADGQSPPPLPAGDDERDEQEDTRILETRRKADSDTGKLDPPSHHQRQRHRHAERQRDVGDSLTRVGDVDRAHRDCRPPRRSPFRMRCGRATRWRRSPQAPGRPRRSAPSETTARPATPGTGRSRTAAASDSRTSAGRLRPRARASTRAARSTARPG